MDNIISHFLKLNIIKVSLKLWQIFLSIKYPILQSYLDKTFIKQYSRTSLVSDHLVLFILHNDHHPK